VTRVLKEILEIRERKGIKEKLVLKVGKEVKAGRGLMDFKEHRVYRGAKVGKV
jgi:hypothetical protein